MFRLKQESPRTFKIKSKPLLDIKMNKVLETNIKSYTLYHNSHFSDPNILTKYVTQSMPVNPLEMPRRKWRDGRRNLLLFNSILKSLSRSAFLSRLQAELN